MVYCVNVAILVFLVGIHCFVASLASKIYSLGGLCRPFVRRADCLMVRSIFQLNSNTRNVEFVFPHAHPLVELDSSGTRHEAVWDSSSERFVDKRQRQFNFRNFFLDNFYPGGTLAPDYYRYAGWRATQRLISATNGVFGTQALIMALGIKKKHLGAAAATAWVLKDSLGKVARILWATLNGRKFDGDAKKWRFRAALLFIAGNALEITTYLFPSTFVVTAALANAMKQMAMVTSSATRSTIYKSFARSNDNIGDITAKGEAQIAVIDLLGLLLGVRISGLTELTPARVAAVFALLSAADLYCVHQEIRSVVFQSLNFERCEQILPTVFAALENNSGGEDVEVQEHLVPSIGPEAVARTERLLGRTRVGEGSLRTWRTLSSRDPAEVRAAVQQFAGQKCVVMVQARPLASWLDVELVQAGVRGGWLAVHGGRPVVLRPEILVHATATSQDVFRAVLIAHHMFHRLNLGAQQGSPIQLVTAVGARTALSKAAANSTQGWGRLGRMWRKDSQLPSSNDAVVSSEAAPAGLDWQERQRLVKESAAFVAAHWGRIHDILRRSGWDTERFMFGAPRGLVDW